MLQPAHARGLVVAIAGVALAVFVARTGKSCDDAPRTPTQGSEVLEKLDVSATPVPSPDQPLTPDDAAQRARQLIQEARARGNDPRLLGRAQAVLQPWWNDAAPPASVRLMRATLRQALHDFDGALIDLNALAEAKPDEPQVWLTRATVLQVLGRHAEADASCEHLKALVAPLVYETCHAPLVALQGHSAEAITQLTQALAASRASKEEQAWSLSVLGELHVWANRPTEAATILRAALKIDASDDYTRGLLADLLLEGNAKEETRTLLQGKTDNDALLLRLVLAELGTTTPEAEAHRALLASRVEAQRQRGETLHAREESRYALAVEHDVPRALALAKDDFGRQHEPADVLVLLEAAAAAKSSADAKPALDWLESTGFEQRRLRELAQALRDAR